MIKKIIKNLSNLPGWRTQRKILVIESDDWGSIRTPSNKVREILVDKNIPMLIGESKRFSNNDTLANAEDFNALFDTLSKFEDIKGVCPVFTAVSVVANPDFEKIEESNFKHYFYEPFTTTLEKYNHQGAFKMWQEGVISKLFVPQFHGREHLNVMLWMRQLQANDPRTLAAFNLQCWGFLNKNKINKISYHAAFDPEMQSDITYQESVIKEGLELFENIHGYKSDFFVPPNGPFNNSLEVTAAKHGIKYMSASKIQSEPQAAGQYKKHFHWLGQKNKNQQYYITRNCFFEPSNTSKDWVASCLLDIENAFKWKKPAVISSHRLNYIVFGWK